MDNDFLVFDSDYLQQIYYIVGKYSILKTSLCNRLLRIYFTKDPEKNCECDILVVNIAEIRHFALLPFNHAYRCVIYTLRPFESLIRFLGLGLRHSSLMVETHDVCAVLYVESSAPGAGRVLGKYSAMLEALVNEYMQRHDMNEYASEEDIEKLEGNLKRRGPLCSANRIYKCSGLGIYDISGHGKAILFGRRMRVGQRAPCSVLRQPLPARCSQYLSMPGMLQFHADATRHYEPIYPPEDRFNDSSGSDPEMQNLQQKMQETSRLRQKTLRTLRNIEMRRENECSSTEPLFHHRSPRQQKRSKKTSLPNPAGSEDENGSKQFDMDEDSGLSALRYCQLCELDSKKKQTENL